MNAIKPLLLQSIDPERIRGAIRHGVAIDLLGSIRRAVAGENGRRDGG